MFTVVDISAWDVIADEPMGGKTKEWRRAPDGRRWLFKEVTRSTHAGGTEQLIGEDWAEKVVSELAAAAGIPCASVELASDRTRRGCISASMIEDGEDLVHGNELLWRKDPAYPKAGTYGAWYTVERVLEALDLGGKDVAGNETVSTFVGYLMLDAWVSNSDRHHENWGVLVSGAGRARLAPSFDHASSLGFGLTDEERAARLSTRDVGYGIETWARRGRSPFYASDLRRLTMLDVARRALAISQLTDPWSERINAAQSQADDIVARVPDAVMSGTAKMFATRLLGVNTASLAR